MSGEDLHQRYVAAIALANELIPCVQLFPRSSPDGHQDEGLPGIVTEADQVVEDLLRRRIAEAFPNDGFLGEEGGGANNDNLWIVDPIDGTANFGAVSHTGPYPSPSRGMGYRKSVSSRCRHLTSCMPRGAGDGVVCNGLPIRVSDVADMQTAAVEIGWSPRRSMESYIGLVADVMSMGATVKRSASGALGMAWTACGRVGYAYLELHINSCGTLPPGSSWRARRAPCQRLLQRRLAGRRQSNTGRDAGPGWSSR